MARLALLAPPSGCTVLIPLIYNTLIQHISAQVLLHRTATDASAYSILFTVLYRLITCFIAPVNGLLLSLGGTDVVKVDPYNFDEPDPAKCRALESSLWELHALGNHYSPTVATLAKLFSGGELRRQRYDLSDFIDNSYQTVRICEYFIAPNST